MKKVDTISAIRIKDMLILYIQSHWKITTGILTYVPTKQTNPKKKILKINHICLSGSLDKPE